MNLRSIARAIPKMALAVLSVVLIAACGTETADSTTTTEEPGPGDPIRITFDFQNGSDGWAADVSDFSEDTRPEDILAQTGDSRRGSTMRAGTFAWPQATGPTIRSSTYDAFSESRRIWCRTYRM